MSSRQLSVKEKDGSLETDALLFRGCHHIILAKRFLPMKSSLGGRLPFEG